MNSDTLLGMANNAALLLTLVVLYETIPLRKSQRSPSSEILVEILTGVLLGGIGMVIMLTPWRFAEGVIFDTRSVLLSLVGLFYGALPTGIAVLMTSALRIHQGGAGAFTGVAVIVTSAGLGLGWRYLLRHKKRFPTWWELYAFGLIVHLAMLAWMFSLPGGIAPDVLSKITAPVLSIYPVATVLMGLLLTHHQQRIQMEEALRDSEALFSTAFQTSPLLMGITRVEDGRFIAVNQTFLNVIGYTREELLTLTTAQVGLWADPADRAKMFEEIKASGKIEGMPIDIRTRSGEIRHVLFSAAPVTLGGESLLIGAALDITERTRAEQALADQVRYTEQLLQTTLDGYILADTEGQVIEVNPAYCRMVGYTQAELLKMNIRDLERQLAPEEIEQRIQQMVAEGGARFETKHRHKAGRMIDLDVSITMVHTEEGPLVAAFVRDITEQKRAQEALRELNVELDLRVAQRTAELASANAELQAFTYSVSHDLRAPLRAIHSFAQILTRRHRTSLETEGQEYLGYVVQASEEMERLIDDLLNYSRLGRRAVQIEQVDCQQTVEQILERLADQIAESRAEIRIPRPLPVIQADRTLLNQILLNLLENALKYQPPGQKPTVAITWDEDGEWVTLCVEDNGVGIPAQHQAKIFNVFQRLHPHDQYPGTGIGLNLVRRAVELMGGQLGVESEPEQGSVFWMRLPK